MNINQTFSKYKNIATANARAITLGAILSIIFFLLLLNSFKSYQSTVTILVLPKSEIAAASQDEVVTNISKLPRTLNFYDRLLKNNLELRDVAQGSLPSQRKQIWNDMLKVEHVRNSSIIKVSLNASNSDNANMLASKTARNLFDTANFYYNIKTDVDMRLIDGPIATVKFGGWPWLLLLSLILGGLISILFQTFVQEFSKAKISDSMQAGKENLANFSQRFFPSKENAEDKNVEEQFAKTEQTVENVETVSQKEQQQSEHDKELEALNKIIQQDIYPNFPEMPVQGASKASAPDNLPIGDDSFLENFAAPVSTESQPKEDTSKKAEPTPEELKARLNKLLKGEL